MTFDELGDAKYINLETFRKDGTGVKTPVWITKEDGKLYAWTESSSYKVKRIRRNGAIRIAKCTSQGKVESEWLDGQARILDDEASELAARQRLVAKYGFVVHLFRLYYALFHRNGKATVIEITPA